MKITQLLLIGLLIIPNLVFGAEDIEKIRVELSVTADDTIKSRIESYLSRELRSLGDVILTDKNYEYSLSVLALPATSEDKYVSGFVLSIVISKKFDNRGLASFFAEGHPFSLLTNQLYSYPEHWLRTTSEEKLQDLCIEIIAKFDSNILKETRKLNQIFSEHLNKEKL